MKNDSVVLLRLLIIHFLVTAFTYKKVFDIDETGRILRSKWIYIVAGVYALLIYCANSSWFNVWIVPCFFTAFVLVSILCHKIKNLPMRLVVFHGILLLLIFSLRVYFSDFQFSSIPAKLHALFHSRSTLLIIFGLIVLIWPVGYVIGQITEPFRKQLSDAELARGLEKAGMWIGCIERTIIYIFVLSNFLTAIAFLVTAKSIFRFGEISKSRKEAEYILIGTLMSYSIAMIVGFLVKYAIR